MKQLLFRVVFVPVILFLAGCKKDVLPNFVRATPVQKTTSSVVSIIAGPHIWHGFKTFELYRDTVIGYVMTITAVNDSVITTSYIPHLQIPYYETDTVNHLVVFWQLLTPTNTLTYNYVTGELHYSLDNGGMHNDDYEIYSP